MVGLDFRPSSTRAGRSDLAQSNHFPVRIVFRPFYRLHHSQCGDHLPANVRTKAGIGRRKARFSLLVTAAALLLASCGGGGSGSSSANPSSNQSITVSVSPASVTVAPTGSALFTATVT